MKIFFKLAMLLSLLFATGGSAQSTNWLSGVNVFSNAVYGTLADNDVVDNATLIITNGGALSAGQLNVGPTNRSTLTLDIGGALTVQTLLATNVLRTGFTTNLSVLNFNGGTLITSNNNGIASIILLASNASWTMNSSWTMNGGTNFFSSVATNPNNYAFLYVGNGVNNVQVNVNSNAVWRHAVPAGSQASNALSLTIGGGNSTNNVFTVNGGVVNSVNSFNIGTGSGSISNQLVVTNGGQFTLGTSNNYFNNINGNYSSIIVAGTNSAGRRAKLDLGGSGDRRLYVSINNTNNLLLVDAGGVVTNAGIQIQGGFGNSTIVANGGQVYMQSGFTVGRSGGDNNSVVVAGFDGSGASSLVSSTSTLDIGGSGNGGNSGTNNWVRVDQGGVVKVTAVNIGGSGSDSNSLGNTLIITNGGQVTATVPSLVGGVNRASSNSVVISGAFGTTNSMLNMGNQTLTMGGSATTTATNNFLTLNTGGILTNVSSVSLQGVNSKLIFNGGKLSAGASGNLIAANTGTTANTATNWVQASGAIIDSGTFGVVSQLPLSQDPSSPGGGLTKLGTGTLLLQGANTFTGPITNSAGTLNFATLSFLGASVQTLSNTISGSGAIIVSSGTLIYNGDASAANNTVMVTNNAGFGGSGTNGGNVFMSAGTALVPGGFTNVGTLTLTNSLTLNGGSLFFDLAAAANDQVVIGNSLALNGGQFHLSLRRGAGRNQHPDDLRVHGRLRLLRAGRGVSECRPDHHAYERPVGGDRHRLRQPDVERRGQRDVGYECAQLDQWLGDHQLYHRRQRDL